MRPKISEYLYCGPVKSASEGIGQLATEELNIRGLTGVDITLRVAGPGTRAYAFIIDWHIRLLVALAWVLAGLLIGLSVGPSFKKTVFPLVFGAPALLIYFLYHPVLELVIAFASGSSMCSFSFVVAKDDMKAALVAAHCELQLAATNSLALPESLR